MYVSINKHLVHFQNCFSGLSWLCQVKGEYTLSNFKYFCRQHNTVSIGNILPVTIGWVAHSQQYLNYRQSTCNLPFCILNV